MANGLITRKDYDKIKDADVKLGILFETQLKTQSLLEDHIKQVEKRLELGEKRFEKIEKDKLKDKGFAGLTGIIGGFLAALTKGGS